jgi:hypothetical protein
MAARNNCSAGSAPDLLYRFQLLPTFNDTYGSDCALVVNAYIGFGSFVIALASIAFLLHLSSLSAKEFRDRTAVRLTCMLLNCSSISLVVVGHLDPEHFHYAKLSFFVMISINITAVIYHGFFTALRNMKRVGYTRQVSQVGEGGALRMQC